METEKEEEERTGGRRAKVWEVVSNLLSWLMHLPPHT